VAGADRDWQFILRLLTARADDFKARSADELSLSRGDKIVLIERDDDFGDGWFLGKHLNEEISGLFPEGKCHNADGTWKNICGC
jgi:hypothetical protein